MATLVLTANRGGAGGGVTIQNNGASDTGYSMVADPDWGMIDPAFVISASPDGIGRITGQQVPPRQVAIPIRVRGTSKANAVTLVSALAEEAAACARSGGVLKWQSNNASYPVYLKVQAAKYVVPQGWHWETHNRADGMLALVCDPLAYGDAMGFTDSFDTNTIGDYTAISGTLPTISLSHAVPAATTRLYLTHTARGYTYTDAEVTVKARTGTVTAAWAVGAMTRLNGGAGTFSAWMAHATASTLSLYLVTTGGGTTASKASAAITAIAANTTYWVRVRCEGKMVTAEWWLTEPTPTGTATNSATYLMTDLEASLYGSGINGVWLDAKNTDGTEYLDEFVVRPYTYKVTVPGVARLTGIPGDADSSCVVDVTQSSGVASAGVWGGVHWGERAGQANAVTNGSFEVDTRGWTIASVGAGMNALATSITRVTTSQKYGGAAADVVATGVSGSGVAFTMYQRFKRGAAYVGLCWMRSAAAVDNASIRIGSTASGDIATGAAIALSTAWKLHTVALAPTSDAFGWSVCALHQTAAIATFSIDGAQLFEVEPVSLSAAITTTTATSMSVTALPPSGRPAVPFIALIDAAAAGQELVRVSAIDTTGLVWTIERGAEGSTAATHASAAVVYPLPGYQAGDFQDGAMNQYLPCIIDAESADSLSNWSISADANALGGNKLLGAAATTFQAKWAIDPGLFVAPQFSSDEVLVEVWARVEMGASVTAPRLTLSVSSEDGSSFGAQRYDLENGSQGLALTIPTGTAFRYVRLGVVSVPVADGARRRRVYLTLDGSTTSAVAGFNIDYLVLALPNRRATSPTGLASSTPYQPFMPSTSQTTRTIRSDLSSALAAPPKGSAAATGVVGAPLVLPTPNADVLVKLSSLVPNDPTSLVTSETPVTYAPAVSINPTPRFWTIR